MNVTRGAAVRYYYLVLQCFHVGYASSNSTTRNMTVKPRPNAASTSSIFTSTTVNATPSTTQVNVTSTTVPTTPVRTTGPPIEGDGMLKNWEIIIIGVAVGVGCFLVLAIAFVICYKKKKRQVEPNVTETAHGLSERVGDEHHLAPAPIVKGN